MADEGRRRTDKIQERMERAITREYRQAHKEVQAKLDEYLARFAQEDKRMEARVRSGEITKKEHNDWRIRHIGMGQRWEELRDNLAKGYHNANQNAMQIAKGYIPEVFVANYEYGTLSILRQGTLNPAFTMVNRDFVDTLIRDNPKLLPDPTPGGPTARMLAENKDLRWNRNKLQSAMIQGCLQGEGIRDIADRFQAVTDMNRKAALRNARTAMTGAAGAGRLNSYRRAERHGIPLVKEWSANLDNVTRDSHVDVNGERREIEEEFSNGLMHPGGMGPPEEVYNCRCDLIAWVKGHEPLYEKDVYERSVARGHDSDRGDGENVRILPRSMAGTASKNGAGLKTGTDTEQDFVTATTIEEARAYLKDTLGVDASLEYRAVNIDVANMINKEILATYNSFGNLHDKGVLEQVFIATGDKRRYVAAYNPSAKTAIFKKDSVSRKSSLKKMGEQAQEQYAVGFWSTGAKEHAVRHELGHAIEKAYKTPEKMAAIEKLRADTMRECGIIKYEKVPTYGQAKEAGEKLSYYGLQDSSEMIAESVAEYLNGTPRETASAVIDILLGRR